MPGVCSRCVFDSYLINGKELALTHISLADLTLFFETLGHFLYFFFICEGVRGSCKKNLKNCYLPFEKITFYIVMGLVVGSGCRSKY